MGRLFATVALAALCAGCASRMTLDDAPKHLQPYPAAKMQWYITNHDNYRDALSEDTDGVLYVGPLKSRSPKVLADHPLTFTENREKFMENAGNWVTTDREGRILGHFEIMYR